MTGLVRTAFELHLLESTPCWPLRAPAMFARCPQKSIGRSARGRIVQAGSGREQPPSLALRRDAGGNPLLDPCGFARPLHGRHLVHLESIDAGVSVRRGD
jgi:hypothetical protein